MASKKIEQYQAAWNTRFDNGLIKLKLENNQTTSVKTDNPAKFSAILGLLEASKTPYLTTSGWISTSAEEPGED